MAPRPPERWTPDRGWHPAEPLSFYSNRMTGWRRTVQVAVTALFKLWVGAKNALARSAWAALLLFVALPAAAQPYATIGDSLFALGCREACIRPGFGALQCGTFRPAVPANPTTREGWEDRYGVPWGSRGDHSAGIGIIGEFARRADNPLQLRQPYVWTEIDRADAAIVGLPGGRPCHQVVQERFGAACPPGWVCDALSPELAARCLASPPTLTCRGFGFQPHLCYLLQDSGKLSFNRGRPECDPAKVTPPPPPDPVCGDGNLDLGEDCDTCPADQPAGACEVEPPPPPSGCEPPSEVTSRLAEVEAALAALRRAWERWATTSEDGP